MRSLQAQPSVQQEFAKLMPALGLAVQAEVDQPLRNQAANLTAVGLKKVLLVNCPTQTFEIFSPSTFPSLFLHFVECMSSILRTLTTNMSIIRSECMKST